MRRWAIVPGRSTGFWCRAMARSMGEQVYGHFSRVMMPRRWPLRKVWPGAISTECPALHHHPISRAQGSKSKRLHEAGYSVGSTGAPIPIRWDAGRAEPFQRPPAAADSLKVCFLETVLRDRREGLVDNLPISIDVQA
jgi:hypothetical protein